MVLKDQLKTCFIIEWGPFAYRVMPFGLKCAPATFQRAVMMAFAKFLNDFMQVFLNDFMVCGSKLLHLENLKKCLQRC